MATLEYIQKACSKDKTRENLMRVYRDIDCIVATDGHRLHYVNGQSKVEKGFFVDGYDGEFPTWNQVIPNAAPSHTVQFFADKDTLKKLKALLTFHKAMVGSKDYLARLNVMRDGLMIEVMTDTDNMARFTQNIATSTCEGRFEIGINLQYLIDALELPVSDGAMKLCAVTLELHGDTGPMIFKTSLGNALIMPMRLK